MVSYIGFVYILKLFGCGLQSYRLQNSHFAQFGTIILKVGFD